MGRVRGESGTPVPGMVRDLDAAHRQTKGNPSLETYRLIY